MSAPSPPADGRWNLLGKDKTFKSLKCKLIVSLLEPTDTGPFIGFKLHPDLEPAIKDPRLFARIKLIMMAILAKPKYAFPLYEILTDCHSRGERVIRLSLQELKESLGIAGSYYDQFIAFKKEVLRPNLAAINQNTDCQVTYDTYREGRKVAGVVFTIDKQDWRPPLLEEHLRELQSYYQPIPAEPLALSAPPASDADEQAFMDSVKLYQVTETDALQAIRTHGLNGARAIRDYALRQAARRKGTKDQVRDLGAYMARCFREGYGRWEEQDQSSSKRAETASPSARSARKMTSEAERLAAKFKTAFRAHQNQLVDERLERMRQALSATGLSGKEEKHPLDLNSAERRMVAVASLSVREGDLLLLDEPTRDFDPEWQARFEEWMLSRREAIVAVSHDPEFTGRLFPVSWSLGGGRLTT